MFESKKLLSDSIVTAKYGGAFLWYKTIIWTLKPSLRAKKLLR